MTFGDKNIFVSYRREDSAGDTFQLVKSLKQYINEQRIFLDNEKLEPGQDFTKALKQSIKISDVVLVVIGKKWLETNVDGTRPIMEEGNWVRTEITIALRQNKLVIPLLINGAEMPAKEHLPPLLAPLTNKQAKEIYYRTWDNDVKELATFLRQKGIPFNEDEQFRKGIKIAFSKGTFILLLALATGLFFLMKWLMSNPDDNSSTTITQPYAINKRLITGKPVSISPKLLRLNRYNISGNWKPETGTGAFYYKIINTLTVPVLQVWNHGSLEATGTVSQQDSLITLSYSTVHSGRVDIRVITSANGRMMKGNRSLGSASKMNAVIGITLIKMED